MTSACARRAGAIDWRGLFRRALAAHPAWTIADIGRLTIPQLLLALGLDGARRMSALEASAAARQRRDAVLDDIARRRGVMPSDLLNVPSRELAALVASRWRGAIDARALGAQVAQYVRERKEHAA